MLDIQHNVDLTPLNTFALPASAESLVVVRNLPDLVAAVDYARKSNQQITLLGGGSNVLLAANLTGLVVVIKISGIDIVEISGDSVVIKIGGGENWHNLVMTTLEQGWFGLENLSLIPGTVGAAPVQNIGAFGVELRDCFMELEAVDLTTGDLVVLNKAACEFGYRDSVFKHRLKNKMAIATVTLKLSTAADVTITYPAIQNALARFVGDQITPALVSDIICQIRRTKLPDPANTPNAGSFFKNPVVTAEQADQLRARYAELVTFPAEQGKVKLAAGWLIEHTGWKGKTLGPVGVHSEQALVLVNLDRGDGRDILALAEKIAGDVLDKFGLQLEIEPRVLPEGFSLHPVS